MKKIYDLDNLITILDNNQILSGITYLNFDENYHKVSKYLNKNKIDYINSIKKIETQRNIQFTEDEVSLKPKYLDNQNKLKYFDDFDIKLASFIRQNFNNITMFLAEFVEIDHLFLIIIENQQRNYFEITDFNSYNIFTFYYLIEIVKNNLFRDKVSLNNFIYNVFSKNGIRPLYLKGNPISLENNKIIFNLYNSWNFDDETAISSKNSDNQKKNLVTIEFVTISQKRTKIQIDKNKNVRELVKLYFEKIYHPELFGDSSIFFLKDAGIMLPNDLIKSYFGKERETLTIIVVDQEEKIN